VPVTDITSANANEVLTMNELVVVSLVSDDLSSQAQSSLVELASYRHPDCTFVTCDISRSAAVAEELGVQMPPAIVIIRQRVLVYRQPGPVDGSEIDRVIERTKELDIRALENEIERDASPEAPRPGAGD